MKNSPISRIREFMSLPGEALVRLYSFQKPEAWTAAEERGYWTGVPEAVDEDAGFRFAYDWMRVRMYDRIPGYSGDLPMWAWTKRHSSKPKHVKESAQTGMIRLTVMVPRSRILISDFERWHYVLNKWIIHENENDFDVEDELYPEGSDIRAEVMETSWNQIFDFIPTTDPVKLSWAGRKKTFPIQACVDRFYWNEIVSVRHF